MTVDEARGVLGKLSDNIADEEIRRDIEVAELFKNFFFDFYFKKNKLGKPHG